MEGDALEALFTAGVPISGGATFSSPALGSAGVPTTEGVRTTDGVPTAARLPSTAGAEEVLLPELCPPTSAYSNAKSLRCEFVSRNMKYKKHYRNSLLWTLLLSGHKKI